VFWTTLRRAYNVAMQRGVIKLKSERAMLQVVSGFGGDRGRTTGALVVDTRQSTRTIAITALM